MILNQLIKTSVVQVQGSRKSALKGMSHVQCQCPILTPKSQLKNGGLTYTIYIVHKSPIFPMWDNSNTSCGRLDGQKFPKVSCFHSELFIKQKNDKYILNFFFVKVKFIHEDFDSSNNFLQIQSLIFYLKLFFFNEPWDYISSIHILL